MRAEPTRFESIMLCDICHCRIDPDIPGSVIMSPIRDTDGRQVAVSEDAYVCIVCGAVTRGTLHDIPASCECDGDGPDCERCRVYERQPAEV